MDPCFNNIQRLDGVRPTSWVVKEGVEGAKEVLNLALIGSIMWGEVFRSFG